VIRRARLGDIPAIIDVGHRLMQRGAFAYSGIDFRAAVDRLTRAVQSRTEFIAVAIHKEQVVGFLILVAQPMWWQPSKWQVVDDLIYCERPGLGRHLLKLGIAWAHTIPRVCEIIISLNSNIDTERATKALVAHGMTKRGVTLSIPVSKEVQSWAA
jgi:hypothetical protein